MDIKMATPRTLDAGSGPALDKSSLSYSLYLVTARQQIHPDATAKLGLPPNASPLEVYLKHLELILQTGKVTILQLREKDVEPAIDNGDFLELAQKSLEICDQYDIPMLINDNISVCLALPLRVGLHIGQSDIPLEIARRMLGPHRLIGVSAKKQPHVHAARKLLNVADPISGKVVRVPAADYVGVGAVYGTQSKVGLSSADILGPRGAAQVIRACHEPLIDCETGERLPLMRSVLIGGINRRTAKRALFATIGPSRVNADGVAVISDIYASPSPEIAVGELRSVVDDCLVTLSGAAERSFVAINEDLTHNDLIERVTRLQKAHSASNATPPLIQTITSHVSSTLSANVALALRASPIMSHQAEEADDLSKFTGAVVLNIGTIGEESRKGMRAVGAAANAGKRPVVLDPVGVGASTFRKQIVEEILNHTQVTLIKGNAAELSSLAGLGEVQTSGVDSGSGSLSDPIKLVTTLAQRERCIVLLTGKRDYLTDGHTVAMVDNGHELLGRITGSGCALGVALAIGMARGCAFSQSLPGDPGLGTNVARLMVDCTPELVFAGALLGLLSVTIASELAAEDRAVHGPGTFIPAWLDALSRIDESILASRAKLSIHKYKQDTCGHDEIDTG
ncbi:HK-domain-containing protein, partial [Tilletiaria anomala UBC 951]